MAVEVEALFTAALGLRWPWAVETVELNTAKRRIDFEVGCCAKRLACPHCGVVERHLDFFQFEAWLHAEVPRASCTGGGSVQRRARCFHCLGPLVGFRAHEAAKLLGRIPRGRKALGTELVLYLRQLHGLF